MKTPKREINLLDKEVLIGLIKKRDKAHTKAQINKGTSVIGFSLIMIGLSTREPITTSFGVITTALSTLAKMRANKKENEYNKYIQELCGNQYIIVGKGSKSEVINLNDQEFEQEK